MSAVISDPLQVCQAGISTVKQHKAWLKVPFLSFFKHRLEMIVFALISLGLGIDPKVAGDESFPIGPKDGLKVDATHHWPVLAIPMVGDLFHLLGIEFVKSGVHHQEPLFS
jgi:hypothetical protein